MKRVAIFFILPVLIGCFSELPERHKRVGGPCTYRSYPGEARVVSIERRADGKFFEVRFEFVASEKINEPYAKTEGKTYHLYDHLFRFPTRSFLERNRITVGRKIKGYLMAITQGTCTPVVFSFPELAEGE